MKVLILGNGFELDYGFETSYADFIKSKPWKELYQGFPSTDQNNLATFLNNEANRNHWFCLESSIAKYIEVKQGMNDFKYIDEDREFFEALIKALEDFLLENYYTENNSSLAHSFIKELISKQYFDKIFTFNYFPNYILNVMGLDEDLDVEYVHNMWGQNILVGVNEPVIPEYKFLCKTYSPYHKTSIKNVLGIASDVVIFGHSMNMTDSVYFVDFLKTLSKNNANERRCNLTIITKNEESIFSIKASISKIGIVVTDLQSFCNLEFISTEKYEVNDYEETQKVQSLFNRLKGN